MFTYAGRGFLVGGMVGISAGYLVARSGGWDSDKDWQPLAYGTGIGALAGGALGLTLGILDMNRNTPGYGAVILRDTVYGAGFGAVAGGIVGTLTFISTDEERAHPAGRLGRGPGRRRRRRGAGHARGQQGAGGKRPAAPAATVTVAAARGPGRPPGLDARPSWAATDRSPLDRVGVGGLCPPEPERGGFGTL